jgi:multisubunit Na+/H+ antiporter MnhB subunit
MMPGLVLDGLLALALPLVAWRAISAKDLFQACVVFIAYGLLLSLSWVRLGAPDVALAEAGIGAGFTGALLLDAAARLRSAPERPRPHARLAAVLCAGVGATLLWALWTLPGPAGTVPELVRANMTEGGVKNPVTAVLLDFRAYDTLLEVGVLWLAAVAAWSVLPSRPPGPADVPGNAGPLLPVAARLAVPVMLLVALYMLWVGSSAPGGAFQAAALLAGAAVVLLVAGRLPTVASDRWPLRVGLLAGLAVFLAVAVGVAGAGGRLLEYPRELAYPLILIIEAVATLSITLVLAALFMGRRYAPGEAGPEEEAP